MIHGLNNAFLYAAKKITVKISNGKEICELMGTGFFVSKDNDLILVTNRHMVDPEYYSPKFKGYKIQDFQIESFQANDVNGYPKDLTSVHVINFDAFIYDANNDVACLFEAKLSEDLIVTSNVPFSFLANKEWIEKKLTVCDTIAYPGFPLWFDRRNNTPIFRMGTIASDPRLDYAADSSEPKASKIAYEGFSSGGASGSPVFAIQKGFPVGGAIQAPQDFYREVKVVGVNAGHFSTKDEGHSGISFFYKSSVVIDLIDSHSVQSAQDVQDVQDVQSV